jgi:Stress up-regulated Nod 19
MDPNSNTWLGMASGLPSDITLLQSAVTLTYEDGSPANIGSGIYNHHISFAHSNKQVRQPLACGEPEVALKGKQIISSQSTPMGVGEDNGQAHYSSLDGKFNAGYYFRPGSELVFMGEVINYSNITKQIYTVVDMHYFQGKSPNQLDSNMIIFDVQQCDKAGPQAIAAPHGQQKFSWKSQPVTIVEDGYILQRRGHLHDGGVNIVFKVNNATICDSQAIYGGNGQTMSNSEGKVWKTISDMVTCFEPYKVQKGDRAYLEANYDLTQHPP